MIEKEETKFLQEELHFWYQIKTYYPELLEEREKLASFLEKLKKYSSVFFPKKEDQLKTLEKNLRDLDHRLDPLEEYQENIQQIEERLEKLLLSSSTEKSSLYQQLSSQQKILLKEKATLQKAGEALERLFLCLKQGIDALKTKSQRSWWKVFLQRSPEGFFAQKLVEGSTETSTLFELAEELKKFESFTDHLLSFLNHYQTELNKKWNPSLYRDRGEHFLQKISTLKEELHCLIALNKTSYEEGEKELKKLLFLI